MSDYLHALVERAHGEARSVRPLLAPRFAPAADGGNLEVDVEVAATAPLLGVEPHPAAVPRAGRPAGPTPLDPQPSAPLPRDATRERTVDRTQAAPLDAPTPAARAANPPPDVSRVQETTRLVERHFVEERTRLDTTQAPIEVRVERAAVPDPPAELSPQPASRVAPAALRTIVVERVEGREPPAAPEAETQTVVVSIGRIEVNAERPAPLPAPAASTGWAGPRLSLDDYLWERNGGGGR